MTDAKIKKPKAPRWRDAKEGAGDLFPDLPLSAEGTAIYVVTDGLDHASLVLLRAYIRSAERRGHRMKLL